MAYLSKTCRAHSSEIMKAFSLIAFVADSCSPTIVLRL